MRFLVVIYVAWRQLGRFRVQGSKFNVQQAVEKQLACFDLAQHERIFARDLKTYSVRPELGRRVNGVFQQLVKVGTGVDTLNLER